MRIAREITPADFDAQWRLCCSPHNVNKVHEADIRHEFEIYSRSGATRSIVLEDSNRSHDQVVSILVTTFITPAFADFLRTATRPFICKHMAEWVDGGRNPFPSLEEMATQTADKGLTLLLIDWGWDRELSQNEVFAVKSESMKEFVRRHGGWRIRSIIGETHLRYLHEGFLLQNYEVKNTYEPFRKEHVDSNPEFDPVLFELNADRAGRTVDPTLLDLFRWQKPQCQFAAQEFRFLEFFVEKDTSDEEIADHFKVSQTTVRKVRSRVYHKLAAVYTPGQICAEDERKTRVRELLIEHHYERRPYKTLQRRGPGRPRVSEQ